MLDKPRVAIVDHGLGNLYNVQRACARVGLNATVTAEKKELIASDAVILPGVGAFGDAMATLRRLDLVAVLRDVAASPKPLVGLCLGVQLLMSESYEFGSHQGLGIIEGTVTRLDSPREGERQLKVPQIGWNAIERAAPWENTLLAGVQNGAYMYFLHSFVVRPQDARVVLSTTHYGQIEFCSSVQYSNVFACQFHPERSGWLGLRIFENLRAACQSPNEVQM